MRTPVITHFAKNARSLSTRRRIAVLATTTVLAGGVQLLTTDTAWACSGPYQANNPTVSKEALNRIHNGDPVSAFTAPTPGSLAVGGTAEIGVEIVNSTAADYEAAAPSLTLRDAGGRNHLRPEDVTVEVLRGGSWTKLGIDNGCGGEAVRVDTSPLLQKLAVDRGSRNTFRVSLAAGAPQDLTSISLTTSAWAELSGGGKTDTRTIKVTHAAIAPAAAKPSTPAKPTAKPKAAPAKPAADETKAATPAAEAPKSVAPTATPAAPTAPAGTPELAQTGSSSANGFLAASAAALLALGAGVLIAVRRLRPQR